MVSWAVYPALDPYRPAGLSPVVVQGELRQRLGFQGVTITDALEAGALRGYGTIARRGQLAALAGMDLLLCAGHRTGEGRRARGRPGPRLPGRPAQPGGRPGRGGPDRCPAQVAALVRTGASQDLALQE